VAKAKEGPQKVDLLLTGCDVVTIDGKNSVIRDGAVAVKGNKIAWIGKAAAAKRQVTAASTIDGSGQIAMPGLIDAHVHTAQTLLRGKIAEIGQRRQVKIPVWRNYYIPFEGMLTDEDVYLSGLLCYANMISVGTTCFAEAGGPHPDAMGRAALDIGIRGFVSLNTVDQGAPNHDRLDATVLRPQRGVGETLEGQGAGDGPGAGVAVVAPDHRLLARLDQSHGRGGPRPRRQDTHPSLRGRLRDRLCAREIRQAAN
jgi:cytosine/adenosine deaminase-related metal-dependent hydrolase